MTGSTLTIDLTIPVGLMTLAEIEKLVILETYYLKRAETPPVSNNKIARILGITDRTLRSKLKAYGIKRR